jgi:(2Fe-2S) ferredoxin
MTTWNLSGLSGTRHHNGADGIIHTTRTRCQGRCEDACVVTVYPEGSWFKSVTPELARRIVSVHLLRRDDARAYELYILGYACADRQVRSRNIEKGCGK